MGNFTCSFLFLVFLLICDSYGLPRRDLASSDEDDCHQIMDIAILGDISQSMKEADRHHLVDIVNALVDKLGVSTAGNHFGLVTFGDRATVHHNFSNTNYHNATNLKRSVADALKVVPEKEGTRTDMAENLALTKLFDEEGGDRPNAINVMLIFTDGIPYIADWDNEPQIPFAKLTKDLEAKNVTIKVIGIGPGAAQSEDKMKQTAGKKGKVVLYSNFTVLSNRLYEDFKEFVCAPVDGKYTNWSPASECSVTCGIGIQTLRRTCTNPPPSNGGRNCTRWGPAEKTISCNVGRCPITRACPTDVVFIVDSSGSVESEFNDAKEVVKKLVTTLDKAPGKNRAAMVLFGPSASQVAQFGQYETVDKFQDAVQQLPRMGGRTRIDKALKVAVNQVLPAARQGVYKIDIILTDGVQSSGARGLKQTSKPLRDAGVRVLAVGIGTGENKRRLRLMTDRDEDVVDAKNIQEHLQGILDYLSQNDCTPPKPGAPQQPTPPKPTVLSPSASCVDDPVHARMCQKRATEDFCWFHPDFSATYCPKSCKLCV
ncbi:matrilin-1-like isoform X4 [Oculina patagonica]